MRLDYLFKDSPGIDEAQVVQRLVGEIVIRYVPNSGFSPAQLDSIVNIAKKWISPSLKVEFERVNRIERSPSGKFKAVKSELIS